jgi:hypothetical protein
VRDFGSKRSTARSGDHPEAADGHAPGKRTLTGILPSASAPVQQKAATSALAPVMPAGPRRTIHDLFPGVQRKSAGAEPDTAAIHASAQRGVATATSPLPHAGTIQRLFGRHDISGIQAHAGPDAMASAREMEAEAYATGNHVVLGAGTDLHTVAHEAAHVVQQRGGVQLKGGVGDAGDAYEQQADEVADAVVSGESAEELLDSAPGEHAPAATEDGAGDDTIEDAGADATVSEDAASEDADAGATEIEEAGVEDSAEPIHDEAGLDEHAEAAPAAAGRPGAAPVVQMARRHDKRKRGKRAPPRSKGTSRRQPDRGRIQKPRRRLLDMAQPRKSIMLQLGKLKDHEMSELVGGMSQGQFKHLLHSITPKERGKSKLLLAQTRLRVALQAGMLQGKLRWSGPSAPDKKGQIDTCGGTNQFAIWMRGGKPPTDTSGMNCWEMVLYVAFKANAITVDWIRTIHRLAAAAYKSESSIAEKQDAYYNVLSDALGCSKAAPVLKGKPVPAGHIVFFNGLEHVAISNGTLNDHGEHGIMSLWSMPRKDYRVQNTTIERVVQADGDSPTVTHAPPPWG